MTECLGPIAFYFIALRDFLTCRFRLLPEYGAFVADRQIPRGWCEKVARQPLQTEVQPNGRIRCWGFIREAGRYLRVVLLEDGVTLHTSYFDRNYEKKVKR